MAVAAKPPSANVDSYMGSLIGLITKSEIRYEGFLFHLNAEDTTIGLRNVKSFGTEGRKKDGLQVPPSDKIYEYIFFRGSDIKDLQVISSPPVQSTPSLPDDPAIIQSHFSHLTSTPTSSISSGAVQVTTFSCSAQSGFPVTSLQGSPSLHQSVENPVFLSSSLPPFPVNNNMSAIPNNSIGFPGSLGGIYQVQQRHFPPPPPQGLVVSHHVQQQSDPSTTNVHLVTSSPSILEPPCPVLPPIGTISPHILPLVPPSAATQSNLGLFPMPVFNLSPGLTANETSSSRTTSTVDTSSQWASSSATRLNVTTSVSPVYEAARSVFGAASHYPALSVSAQSNTEIHSMSRDKSPVWSTLTSGQLLQPDPEELPSFHLLQTSNNDTEIVQASKTEPLSSKSENAGEPVQRIAKPPANTMRGSALSSHYYNGHNSWEIRDETHKDVSHNQSSMSRSRGKVNESYGAASDSHYGNRNNINGRRHGLKHRPLHHQNNRSLGREKGLNGLSLHNRHLGRSNGKGGSKVAHTVAKFTEDFDFEAMNEKFNKEEVWGLIGRGTKSRKEDENGDEEETSGYDVQEEAGEGLLKADRKPVYCKDEFFDTLSCNTLDNEPGKGKMKFSEQRRIDSETFGEVHKHQRGRGIQGPRRAGGSQGSYRGRGYDNPGRNRGRTVWSRVT